MLRVRARRVRAIEERFYGRTARLFFIGKVRPSDVTPPPWPNDLAEAAAECEVAYLADRLYSIRRHARIPRERAVAFWDRVAALVDELAQLPREGDMVHGLVAGLYSTDHPPTTRRYLRVASMTTIRRDDDRVASAPLIRVPGAPQWYLRHSGAVQHSDGRGWGSRRDGGVIRAALAACGPPQPRCR